jgi:LAO/AO transport system kinase
VGDGAALARRLLAGDLSAAPGVLNLIESRAPDAVRETDALLAELSPRTTGREPQAHIIGLTGPPGVGKSSLLSRLVASWRQDQRSVAVLAIDPSSRRSGGSLLGDRARIEHNPDDAAVFIRSMAAGERLGGLAPATRAAAAALAVAFELVVIETVGVGQSETDVADVADTVTVVVQPGAGDALQFLKAGIMEVPDVLVVAKADLGEPVGQTVAELHAALRSLGAADAPVLTVSAIVPVSGVDELVAALDAHRASLDLVARRHAARRAQALDEFTSEFGERGVRSLGGRPAARRALHGMDGALDVRTLCRELGVLAGAEASLKETAEQGNAAR